MAFSASEIRFKIVVGATAQTLSFEDTTDYSSLSVENSGLLKILDPLGNPVYKNIGYDTDVFTAPDIITSNSVQNIISDIDISELVKGTYTVYYKIANVTFGTAMSKNITANDTTKSFVISSVSTVERDAILAYGWLKLSSGDNIGSYPIISYTYAGTDLTIITSEDVIASASAAVDVENSVSSVIYETNKTFKWCYTAPTVSINYTVLCETSTLYSTDNTDYSAVISGVSISPVSTVITHSVVPPAGSGFGNIPDSSSSQRVFEDIWTNIWQTAISTDVTYNVEVWDTGIYWYTITDTITGADSANVACSTCACEMAACIQKVYAQWLAAIPVNIILAGQIETDVLKLTALYTQFMQAERCGNSTTGICASMKAILNGYNCSCETAIDPASKLVIPVKDRTPSVAAKGLFTLQVSFEAGEIGFSKIKLPMDCTINSVEGYVSKEIGDTSGNITIDKNGTSIGVMTVAGSALYGSSILSTVSDESFLTGDYLGVTTDTATDGRVYLTINYTKI